MCVVLGCFSLNRTLLGSKQWAEFKAANPAVEVEGVTRGNIHPHIQAEYGTRSFSDETREIDRIPVLRWLLRS